MHNNIRFSWIVPIYNEGIKLKKTLDMYACNCSLDSELILVDDGSTDVSGKICDEIAQTYVNVAAYHKENGGCVDARRYGIQKAKGEYIVFLDADDKIDENYEKNLNNAVANKADFYILNNQINIKGTSRFEIEKDFITNSNVSAETAWGWILTGKAGAVWDKIYVAQYLKELELSDKITYGEDVYINCNYMNKVKTVYTQNTASYMHYIDSPTSVCKVKKFNQLDEIEYLYKVIRKRLEIEGQEELLKLFTGTEMSTAIRVIIQIKRSGVKKEEIVGHVKSFNLIKNIKEKRYKRILKNEVNACLIKHSAFRLAELIYMLKDKM